MQQKKEEKARKREEQETPLTFEAVAREWFDKKSVNLNAKYRKEKWQRIVKNIYPYIGAMTMEKVTFGDLVATLAHLHDKADLGKRIAQILGQICRYATAMQYSSLGDVSRMLEESLPDRPPVKHRARLTDSHEIGILLNAIDEYDGYAVTRYALQNYAPRLFAVKRTPTGKMEGCRLGEGNLDYSGS